MHQDNLFFSALIKEQYYLVEGEKSRAFLQGQLTNDLLQLSPSHCLYTAHCDIKGRIVALYHIWQKQDSLFLKIASDIASTAIPTLEKYAKFSRVELKPIGSLATLVVWGDGAAHFLKNSLGVVLNDTQTCWQHDEITVLYTKHALPSYQIIAPLEICLSLQTPLDASMAYDAFCIQQGIARLYPETVGLFTPHEFNLPQLGAVSFQKGCYTGQEIVARMQYRGKIKSHLYQAMIGTEKTPIPGCELKQNDRSCGRLVMAAKFAENQYTLLAVLQDDAIINPVVLDHSHLQDIAITMPSSEN